MKRYQSHKIVEAAKVTHIIPEDRYGKTTLAFEDGLVEVDVAYMEKHKPEIGGYYVRYPDSDGYESYSPAGPFERGNTEVRDETEAEQQATAE